MAKIRVIERVVCTSDWRAEMAYSLIERQLEQAVQDMFDDKAGRFMRALNKIAAKQGGDSIMQNYQLLGKRALIVAGVAAVGVQVVSYVLARRSEEARMERVARRVLAEERQKEEAEAQQR